MVAPLNSPVSVTITGLPRVRAMLRALGRAAFQESRKALRTAGRELEVRFAERHLKGRTGSDNVAPRSGGLARSFGHAVTGDRLERLRLDVGFGPPAHAWQRGAARYARTHLKGGGVGEIKPTGGRKYLAIPVQRTRAGLAQIPSLRDLGVEIIWVRRAAGAAAAGRFRAPLEPTKAFAFPMKRGEGWVVTYGGRVVFLLVPSVIIKERLPLHEAFRAFEPRLVEHLDAAAQAAVRKANQAGGGA